MLDDGAVVVEDGASFSLVGPHGTRALMATSAAPGGDHDPAAQRSSAHDASCLSVSLIVVRAAGGHRCRDPAATWCQGAGSLHASGPRRRTACSRVAAPATGSPGGLLHQRAVGGEDLDLAGDLRGPSVRGFDGHTSLAGAAFCRTVERGHRATRLEQPTKRLDAVAGEIQQEPGGDHPQWGTDLPPFPTAERTTTQVMNPTPMPLAIE